MVHVWGSQYTVKLLVARGLKQTSQGGLRLNLWGSQSVNDPAECLWSLNTNQLVTVCGAFHECCTSARQGLASSNHRTCTSLGSLDVRDASSNHIRSFAALLSNHTRARSARLDERRSHEAYTCVLSSERSYIVVEARCP